MPEKIGREAILPTNNDQSLNEEETVHDISIFSDKAPGYFKSNFEFCLREREVPFLQKKFKVLCDNYRHSKIRD